MSSDESQSFNPYHRWLGIPPKDQPPNLYRLLGIELFEDDPAVIRSAAALVLLFLLSVALFLRPNTNTGEVVIESLEPGLALDDEVVVTQGGKIVESIELNESPKTVTIRSGQYEVKLQGTNVDDLEMNAKQFTVNRGDSLVVRISRRPIAVARKETPKSTVDELPKMGKPIVAEPPKEEKTADAGGPVRVVETVEPTVKPIVEPTVKPTVGTGSYAVQFEGRHFVELAGTREVASWKRTFTAEMWVRWRDDASACRLISAASPLKNQPACASTRFSVTSDGCVGGHANRTLARAG